MSDFKPWWETVRLPTADSHFHYFWANTALVQQALHGGPKVTTRKLSASLKDEDTVENFLSEFQKAFPQLRLVEEAAGNRKGEEWVWVFVDPQTGVRLSFDGDRKVGVQGYSTSQIFLEALKAFWAEKTTKAMPKGRVHVLITTNSGPSFKSMGVGGEALVRDNYSDKVLEGYDRIIADMNADQPRGRVAILNGEPGTGKTFIVRGLLNDVKDAVMVIVPANLVVQLSQPGMIPALVELHKDSGDRPIIFLIEDADEVLATRMGDNMSAVSAVLNLGDGILGKLLDIRIIATTNAKHQDLDEAIMRPGRLSAHVSVDALPYEKAQEVYKRLLGGEVDLPRAREYTLAEIYQMAFDKGWKPPKETKKVGFASPDLEENDDGDDFDPYE